MPKLRNASNATEMFAQWLGRKVRNHDPLAELKLTDRQRKKKANIYASGTVGDAFVVKADRNTVVCHGGDGRMFEIEVREIPSDRYAPADLEAVGL